MGTLWTPSGEHLPHEEPVPAEPPQSTVPSSADGAMPSPEELSAIREMHQQIRATPVEDIITNHAAGMIQLALIHLGVATPPDDAEPPPMPDLARAGVAIDALGSLIDGLGERLGQHEQPLRDALAQVQQAYVAVGDALDRMGSESAGG